MIPENLNKPIDHNLIPRDYFIIAREFDSPFSSKPHFHYKQKLVISVDAIMRVDVESHRFLIKPGQAVVVPPLAVHTCTTYAPANCADLYIPPVKPYQPVLDVPAHIWPLLAQCATDPLFNPSKEELEMFKAIHSSIDEWLEGTPQLHITVPEVRKGPQVILAILKRISEVFTVEEVCAEIAMSSRTLNRFMLREFGITFNTLRKQLRAMVSLDLLIQPYQCVESVSLNMSYQDTGSFSDMFLAVIGIRPGVFATKKFHEFFTYEDGIGTIKTPQQNINPLLVSS